jgi:HAE1 family hydrophobic/amphiphilic exporter-1
MNVAEIAIRRPVFIVCLVLMMLAVGTLAYFRLPVDQFPEVKMPYINVQIIYPGAGPEEMANLVSKPLEEDLRTIAGVKNVMCYNYEGATFAWVEFSLETNPDYAEQQVRAKVSVAKTRMPKDVEEPLIQRFDVSDQPVVSIALQGPQNRYALYELADRELRPRFEQIAKVSQVKIYGGSKREIQVLLERKKLAEYEVSVSQVGQALEMGGANIPLGKRPDPKQTSREIIYRSLGEFDELQKIRDVVVKYFGNDFPTRIRDLGTVVDTHEDETSRSYVNGESAIILEVYRQSGANTVDVAKRLQKRIREIQREVLDRYPGAKLTLVRDGAKSIRDNLQDVSESILIGMGLTVLVVFFFLGSLRSTLITGVALPNSLIGAFVLVAAAGFSVNTLTLLALSLSVGLLIDDAIVVRENIFRHLEMGKPPIVAALEGTQEVLLAVIATTLAVIAVFAPIAFVGGITGQFLREFGLTVCFVMFISLFDALTVGPMLSARYAGKRENKFFLVRFWTWLMRPLLNLFNRSQAWLEERYAGVARFTIRHSVWVLLISVLLVVLCYMTVPLIPKTFLPSNENGELQVSLELEPGSTLEATETIARKVETVIRQQPAVATTSLIAGVESELTKAKIFVMLKPARQRKQNCAQFKESLRKALAPYRDYRIQVADYDILFGGERPFVIKIFSPDPAALEQGAEKVLAAMKQYHGFLEARSSYRTGKPELRLRYQEERAKQLGVSTRLAGAELRAQIEGITPVKFRQGGEEWDVRVRLQEQDRELQRAFPEILIPNLSQRLVALSQVARLERREGLNTVYRQNSQRMIWISSDVAEGYGVGDLMTWIIKEIKDKQLLPPGVYYKFEGQGEQYDELSSNMALAAFMAILFIYLVLASLYESFITPLALLLPLPLAVSGAFVALWLAKESLNIYSIIATIMLLGIATKNSILLIDYTNQLVAKGRSLSEALVEAGRTRLRPILMTSMALVAGTLPVAIGLNEASKQRSSMGWVIIGGVVSSTLLSLVVVPAVLTLFRGRKTKNEKIK